MSPDVVIKRWAKVRTRFEGYHSYPNAPTEVGFLAHLHRHMFYVVLQIEQFHNERDVEYILCLRWLNQLLRMTWMDEAASCETMASKIAVAAMHTYPGRCVKVEVSEDGENGALVEFNFPQVLR